MADSPPAGQKGREEKGGMSPFHTGEKGVDLSPQTTKGGEDYFLYFSEGSFFTRGVEREGGASPP